MYITNFLLAFAVCIWFRNNNRVGYRNTVPKLIHLKTRAFLGESKPEQIKTNAFYGKPDLEQGKTHVFYGKLKPEQGKTHAFYVKPKPEHRKT